MPTIEDVVEGYIKLRDHKSKIKDKHKEELAPINEKMIKLEGWLLNQLNLQGVESARTEKGTVYKSTRVSATVQDWPAFKEFVLADISRLDMVEHRVSKDAVEAYMEATGGELPSGVSVSSEVNARIRR